MISYEGKDHSCSIAEREAYIGHLTSKTIDHSVYLQTCNRVELYKGDDQALPDTVLHLFRIASGLESKMLGEGHILGQVRRSYMSAIQSGTISCGLHRLFQHALYTGKRVRTETAISRGAVTHSQTAVSLLKRSVPDLYHKKILVIGVNTLTRNIVNALKKTGCKTIVLVNRTLQKAQEMAVDCDVHCVPYNALEDELQHADIIVSAIKTMHPIIRASQLATHRALEIVDLAVPRNIDPAVQEIPGVRLYNIDDVEKEMDQNIAGRSFEVFRAEEIIDEEIARYTMAYQKSRSFAQSK